MHFAAGVEWLDDPTGLAVYMHREARLRTGVEPHCGCWPGGKAGDACKAKGCCVCICSIAWLPASMTELPGGPLLPVIRSAGQGGAVAVYSGGNANFTDCDFYQNRHVLGGLPVSGCSVCAVVLCRVGMLLQPSLLLAPGHVILTSLPQCN